MLSNYWDHIKFPAVKARRILPIQQTMIKLQIPQKQVNSADSVNDLFAADEQGLSLFKQFNFSFTRIHQMSISITV